MEDNYTQPAPEKSAEEVSWDAEFAEAGTNSDGVAGTLAGLAKLAVQVPAAIVQIGADMFPEDARQHARAAVRESFLALRSLLGAVGDSIESVLAEPGEGGKQTATVSGPPGTWGTARAAGASSSSKVKRIEVSESTPSPSSAEAAPTESDVPEDRGLRADIDY